MRKTLVASFLASLASLAACTEANLQPTQLEGPPAFDDKMAIAGSICTKTPSDEFFPVKIMFVIDTSNSMLITDPNAQRVRAVQQVLDRYAGNPAVEFAVIAFDAVVSDITNGFTSNPDISAIANRLDDADRLTDYQGALARAYAVLTRDMMESSPAERARSKYVVIFFSDGIPDPYCEAGNPNIGPAVCRNDRDTWPDIFQLPQGTNPNTGSAWTWEDFQALYPDLDANKDYNTIPQLVQRVEDILQLQEIYNVNELRFHTAFLFAEGVNPALQMAFNLDRARGERVLRAMTEAGNGSFTEFTSGGDISFLNVNYASVRETYALANLFAVNHSSLASIDGPMTDSDSDGIPDTVEDELRLCSYTKGGVNCNKGMGAFADPLDTDGDGYSDLFEHRFRASGFDPKLASDVIAPCSAMGQQDGDGDGLRDCEEAYVGSDPRLFDTDTDRIPDGVEIRFGLDPKMKEDALFDNDADGTRNLEEVQMHYSPVSKERPEALPPKYEYTVTHSEETADGRNCYDFEVRNIQLKTTRGLGGDTTGLNTIMIYFIESPPNDPRDFGTPRVACVKARYVEPDLKQPVSGRLEISEEDFFDPTDRGMKCVGPEPKEPTTGGTPPP